LSLIRPSPVESLYSTLFQLEADRPKYYINIVRIARSIFLSLGFKNKVVEMDNIIKIFVEKPLMSNYISIVNAYDNPRFYYSRRAYTFVGDSIDGKEITRYDIEHRLEQVKDWIFDEVTEISPYIRFTRQTQMMA